MRIVQRSGFTLIELLVVIAIIGVLSSVVLASLSTARAKGRDSRRVQDLNQVRTALFQYYDIHGDWMESGSGCGSGGNGNGWFNHQNGGSYPISMAQCLVNDGLLPGIVIDPTGSTSGSTPTNSTFTYMKYSCSGTNTGTYLFAKLQTVAQSSTAADSTCVPTVDTNYGMNYFLKVN